MAAPAEGLLEDVKADDTPELWLPATPAHLAWLANKGRWAFPAWLQYVNAKVTEFLLDPHSRFLAIEVPVRHGKSWYGSMTVPAWYLGMFPHRQVLLTSYSDRLSRDFGRGAREIIEEFGEELFGIKVRWDARASNDWKLEQGGGMRAVSKGGTITGTGGHLIIIDDPIKDAVEADSKLSRDRTYDWYQRTLRTRLEPGGKIILIMSRWHEDDLTGRLLGKPNWDGDRWEVIHLPAFAEPSPAELELAKKEDRVIDLDTWRDELGRRHGDPLWPQRMSKRALLQTREAVGPIAWNSNYQQVPVTPGGDVFPRHDWQAVNAVNVDGLDLVARIDLAATEQTSGDFTAMGLVGRDKKGFTFILDVRRDRLEASKAEEFVKSTAAEWVERWGSGIHFVLEQEPGSAGKTVAQNYVRSVLGKYSAEAKPTVRAKLLNAQPMAGQQQAGNVFLLRHQAAHGGYQAAEWWSDFMDEAQHFPKGAHDDMVDVVCQAYNDLFDRAQGRKKQKTRVSNPAKANRQRAAGQWVGGPRGR